jgi:transcriptional regulator with XRE-family HTH domain
VEKVGQDFPFAQDAKNVEFRKLVEASGWTQTRVAARLRLSQGVVSQFMSGRTRPSDSTIEHFRTALAMDPETSKRLSLYPQGQERMLSGGDAETQEAAERLGVLKEESPENYQAIKTMIETVYRSTPKGKRAAGMIVNSRKVADVAVASIPAALKAAGIPEPSPKREADEPSGNKRKRARGAGPE